MIMNPRGFVGRYTSFRSPSSEIPVSNETQGLKSKFMNPRGFEPRSTGPKPVILSVELRVL